jgi:hypothetical protein
MATLLEPSQPEVRSAAESARQILVRLGAKPYLGRLEAAIGRPTSAEPPGSRAAEPNESRSAIPT